MVALRNHNWTEAEYLAFENASETKHEYFKGEVYAMAGGSEKHVAISANTLSSLHTQLRDRDCRAYGSDMRVYAPKIPLRAYPDVVIVCGTPEIVEDPLASLLNPTVILEVLSPSTEDYDRGKKFTGYRSIESLQAYVLIAQDRPFVEHWIKNADGKWMLDSEVSGRDGTLELPSIGCTLALAEVYAKVTFDEHAP